MEDILQEFVVETNESIEQVDAELVRFERSPNNREILSKIFRLVHTVKGTCGFLGLPRLEALAHAAESAISAFRAGEPVTQQAVSLILATIDRIRLINSALEQTAREPEGQDDDLIEPLKRVRIQVDSRDADAAAQGHTSGNLVYQLLERELLPGEASLDDLERAFRSTPGPAEHAGAALQPETAAKNSPARKTIRISVEAIENLMTMISELVLTRNQLLELSRDRIPPEFNLPFQRLSQITGELQDSITRARMQPIGNAWASLPRVVRDIANGLNKEVALDVSGEDTEIDRQVLELIKDPFLHMMRNAIDHGIEDADTRRAAGKPQIARISLRAAIEGGVVAVEISDDGGGLDLPRIKESAVSAGILSPAEALAISDAGAADLIFHQGLSTARSISAISGRGIGMDVVRSNVEQCGGTISVRTERGRGSSFTMRIPLTLSIVTALIVKSGAQHFALPQTAIVEVVRPRDGTDTQIEQIGASPVLRMRDELIPFVRLRDYLKIAPDAGGSSAQAPPSNRGLVVICQQGAHRFGVGVSGVEQTEEIVIKPLSNPLRGMAAYSGAAILGNGSVVLTLEPACLAVAAGHTPAAAGAASVKAGPALRDSGAARKTERLLIFRAGSERPMAIPLGLVTRLEQVDAAQIKSSDAGHLIEYRGRLMPVIPASLQSKLRQTGVQPLLIFTNDGKTTGIAVDEIVDIVDEPLNFDITHEGGASLGEALIAGRPTSVIDVTAVIPFLRQSAGGGREPARQKQVLLFNCSEFFRALLSPVIQAQGYIVTAEADARQALDLLAAQAFAAVIADLDQDAAPALAIAASIRRAPGPAKPGMIGLVSARSLDLITRAREAGFADIVGKFDRQGLIASLGALNNPSEAAA